MRGTCFGHGREKFFLLKSSCVIEKKRKREGERQPLGQKMKINLRKMALWLSISFVIPSLRGVWLQRLSGTFLIISKVSDVCTFVESILIYLGLWSPFQGAITASLTTFLFGITSGNYLYCHKASCLKPFYSCMFAAIVVKTHL